MTVQLTILESEGLPAVVDASGGEVAPLAELTERARAYARSSKAANTLRAYESDLRHFGAWCETRGFDAFPAEAETVALYLTDHAGVLAISTLRRAPGGNLRGPPSARSTIATPAPGTSAGSSRR